MPVLKCKMCGGNLQIEEGQTVCECEYCGTKQTVPSVDNEKKLNLYNRANRLRSSNEFDKAYGVFESLVADFPEEAEAYWGLCLCKYGIEYVDDPVTGRKIPTCHRTSFDSIFDDNNFDMALEYADGAARGIYREEAKEIDRLQKAILQIAQNEEPFDIFICYKETDEAGDRTVDSVIAQDVYTALTEKGYKVFFSRITLEDKLGQEYEPYIFAALNSAKIMLAFGTSYEYYNAVWVKNEWSRYLDLMKKDKTKHLIPCFKSIDAYDMPKEFARLQAQDMGKVGAVQDLLRGIEKIFPKGKETAAVASASIHSSTAEPLLRRAYMFLEDKDFANADSYFEKVLDQEPENGDAYLGKFLCELKAGSVDQLISKNIIIDINGSKYISRIRQFGNAEVKKQIDELIQHNNQLIADKLEAERLVAEKKEVARKDEERRKQLDLFLSNTADKKYLNQPNIVPDIYKVAKAFAHLPESQQLMSDCRDSLLKTVQDVEKNITEMEERLFNITVDEVDRETVANDRKLLQEKLNGLKKTLMDYSSQLVGLGLFDVKKKNEIKGKMENVRQEIAIAEKGLQSIEERSKKIKTALMQKKNYAAEVERLKKLKQESQAAVEQLDTSDDTVIDTATLARINFKLSLTTLKKNSTLYFGTYYVKKGETAPIEWIVLSVENNKALLLSKYGLDCQKYNSEDTDVTWETCTLRTWLNNTFYNSAFNYYEKQLIATTVVSADKNPKYSTAQGKATNDKVFLLSITEVNEYFDSEDASATQETLYAYQQGAYDDDDFFCFWWLRTSGSDSSNALCVDSVGNVDTDGDFVTNDSIAVRPALWINLEP